MQREDRLELNFESLAMQKLNIPTDRTQRLDEKDGVICLVIMFTPKVIAIRISKMARFFVYSAYDSKKIVTV